MLARKILRKKYPGADCAFVAGSIMRGEGTPTSDIDLVIIFRHLKNAYRESFLFEKTPIEALVHDPETINHFFAAALEDRHASLIHMVANGTVIPQETDISRAIRKLALKLAKQGPPQISLKERNRLRYSVTDMIDDLRGGLKRDEQLATAFVLFERMSSILQIQSGQWLGVGKHTARNLHRAKHNFMPRFQKALNQLMENGETKQIIKLADDVLRPWGGRLFNGYIDHAPRDFRRKKVKA